MEVKREYYSNGQLSYESNYVNGLRHGIQHAWYENGQLEEEKIMLMGFSKVFIIIGMKMGNFGLKIPMLMD